MKLFTLIFLLSIGSVKAANTCEIINKGFSKQVSYALVAPEYLVKDNDLAMLNQISKAYQGSCPEEFNTALNHFGFQSREELEVTLIRKWFAGRHNNSYNGVEFVLTEADEETEESLREELQDYTQDTQLKDELITQALANQRINTERVAAQSNLPQSECTPKNYTDKLPPYRYQGSDSNICVSMATANLLSVELDEPVSALSLVGHLRNISFAPNTPTIVERERATDSEVLTAMNVGRLGLTPLVVSADQGYCLESEMQTGIAGTGELNTPDYLLETILGKHDVEGDEEYVAGITCRQLYAMKAFFPLQNYNELAELAQSSNGYLMSEAYRRCQRNFPPDIASRFNLTEFKIGEDQQAKQNLTDAALNNGGVVVASIPREALGNPEYITHNPNHAVTIVGRRLNPATNKCEYLIRDSLGLPEKMDSAFTSENESEYWAPGEIIFQNMPHLLNKKVY